MRARRDFDIYMYYKYIHESMNCVHSKKSWHCKFFSGFFTISVKWINGKVEVWLIVGMAITHSEDSTHSTRHASYRGPEHNRPEGIRLNLTPSATWAGQLPRLLMNLLIQSSMECIRSAIHYRNPLRPSPEIGTICFEINYSRYNLVFQ